MGKGWELGGEVRWGERETSGLGSQGGSGRGRRETRLRRRSPIMELGQEGGIGGL